MAFLTLSVGELFHSFNVRSQRGSLLKIKQTNPWLWLALASGTLCTLAVMIWPPAAQLFGFETLEPVQYVTAYLLAAAVIPLVETGKAFIRRNRINR